MVSLCFLHLRGKKVVRKDGIYQMFGNNRAYRLGDWKIVSQGLSSWELYNMSKDPTEKHNLAAQYPEKLEQLKSMWFKVATEDERLPAKLNKPTVNKEPRFKRPALIQGDQRMGLTSKPGTSKKKF